ncbi:hypothetical protein [Bradyrhizobium sp. LMTR 3]|uniref:hypothetical protein n=1 Tax=Bradyrhizobium sp. LMTR 3 TaxID=189873 RepID=UPI001146EAC3|nr:hypothetical protein [Bradyrhizobium sp. LMTR 3]
MSGEKRNRGFAFRAMVNTYWTLRTFFVCHPRLNFSTMTSQSLSRPDSLVPLLATVRGVPLVQPAGARFSRLQSLKSRSI